MCPSTLGSIEGSLDLVPNMQKERKHIKDLSDYLRYSLDREGYFYGNSDTHIVPIKFLNQQSANQCSKFLIENGIWAKAILPPTVTKNKICIRVSVCAFHTYDDIDLLITLLKKFRKH